MARLGASLLQQKADDKAILVKSEFALERDKSDLQAQLADLAKKVLPPFVGQNGHPSLAGFPAKLAGSAVVSGVRGEED